MIIYIDGALVKEYKEAIPLAKILCAQTGIALGQMPVLTKLELTTCGRQMFNRQQDAAIFLKFVFQALTGQSPPTTALTVPVLKRVTEYA
jgi:hypothetical protein